MTMTYEPIYKAKTIQGVSTEGILRKKGGQSYIVENERDMKNKVLVIPSTLKNTGVYKIVGYR